MKIWLVIKTLEAIATELFICGRKLNTSIAFITQPCLVVPKNIRLNTTNYLMKKIANTRKLQQIAFDHLSDRKFDDLIKIYEKGTNESSSFYCDAKPVNPSRFISNI